MPPGQPARPLPRREHEILWRWFLKVSTLSSFVCRSPLGPPCPASRWARKSCHNSIRRLTRRPGTSSPRRMPGARCQPVVPGPAPLLATCGGEIFLEAEWEARYHLPRHLPFSKHNLSFPTTNLLVTLFSQPGVPPPPGLSAKMLYALKTGFEIQICGRVQGPHRSPCILPPPGTASFSCQLIILTTVIIILESHQNSDHLCRTVCSWLANLF